MPVADKKITRRTRRLATKPIPDALIYEMWNGKPIYYNGYRDVLSGKKKSEEIMSCSDLQGVLIALLNGYLFSTINRKKYLLATNEIGLHLALNDNLGNDLAIFEKEKMGKLIGKYFSIPPKVVIEVDIKADVSDFTNKSDGYILQKAQKLIDFGVERVLWIISDLQKVYIIDRNDPNWHIVNWSQDIAVLDGHSINIKQLLDEEGLDY